MAKKPKQIDEVQLMKRLQRDMKGKNPMKEWVINKDALVKKYNVPGPVLFRKLDELVRQQKSANTTKSVDQLKAEKKTENLRAEEEKIKKIIARKSEAKKEAAKVEAAKVEAAKVEAAKVEAAKVEAAKVEAAKVEAAKVEAAKVEAAKVEAAKVEAAKESNARKSEPPKEQEK